MKGRKIFALLLILALTMSTAMPSTAAATGAEVNAGEIAEGEICESIPSAVNYDKVADFVQPQPMVRAMLHSKENTQSNAEGIVFNKSVVSNQDGSYTISMEAYTTGQIIVTDETKPCDIILVLDRSTSMDDKFSDETSKYSEVYKLDKQKSYYVWSGREYIKVEWCNRCNRWTDGCSGFILHKSGKKYTPKESSGDTTVGRAQFYTREIVQSASRMDVLKLAANTFVTSVKDRSPDSKIAVVSFGQNGYIHTNSSGAHLLPVGEKEQTIRNAINGISPDENATEHGKGLEKAKNIFANTDSTGRNPVVVMITDGEPAPKNTNNWSSRVVKEAIENSYTLKNTYKSSVYCISVMPGTDASNPATDMDKYMSYVSSNYPNARYTGKNLDNRSNDGNSYYTGSTSNIIKQITPGKMADTSGGSFYLTAGDVDTLNSIFQKIASQTGGASISLDSSAVIRDTVTPYFKMPEEASKVSVEAVDCISYDEETGAAEWRATGSAINDAVTIEGNMVNATGFDFNHNFVAKNGRDENDINKEGQFHGRKLVITFTICPKDEFLGGNGVPTNASAGIYESINADTPIAVASVDPVNVPVRTITPDAEDQNIYLSNEYDGNLLIGGIDSRIDGINNAYADVTYTITDAENNVIATCIVEKGETAGTWTWSEGIDKSPDADTTTFAISCTVNGGEGNASLGSTNARVYVFKPELTFEDGRVYYGEAAPEDFTSNLRDTKWKHPTAAGTISGEAPTLTPSFTLDSTRIKDGKINTKQDIGVNVTVKIGETDITDKTTFVHKNCEGMTCTPPENMEFVLHVSCCTLTIVKTGGADNETYVFDVYKDGVKYTQASILGNGTATICQLPVGVYTIKEDTLWSWRYAADNGRETVLSRAYDAGSITCTNTKTKPYWLNGFSSIVKNVFGIEH